MGHEGYTRAAANGGASGPDVSMEDIFSQFSDIFGNNNIFDRMFNQGASGAQKSAKKKKGKLTPIDGQDITASITITLKESFTGCKEQITIERFNKCVMCDGAGAQGPVEIKECTHCKGSGKIMYQQGWMVVTQPCSYCNGEGLIIQNPCATCKGSTRIRKKESVTVVIPAGISDEDVLRVQHAGDAGMFGGKNGSLIAQIQVFSDQTFKRQGDNLLSNCKVAFGHLVCGVEMVVKTIDDTEETIKIPAGTQVGDKITIKNKGFFKIKDQAGGGKTRGDFIITITCFVPKKINTKAEEALKVFTEETDDQDKNNKGFLHTFFKKLFW